MEYSKRMKTQPQKESVEIQEEKKTPVIIRSSLVILYTLPYASGALVMPQKGAKNWGTKTKKKNFLTGNLNYLMKVQCLQKLILKLQKSATCCKSKKSC